MPKGAWFGTRHAKEEAVQPQMAALPTQAGQKPPIEMGKVPAGGAKGRTEAQDTGKAEGWMAQLQSILSGLPTTIEPQGGLASPQEIQETSKSSKKLPATNGEEAIEQEDPTSLDPMVQIMALLSAVVTPVAMPTEDKSAGATENAKTEESVSAPTDRNLGEGTGIVGATTGGKAQQSKATDGTEQRVGKKDQEHQIAGEEGQIGFDGTQQIVAGKPAGIDENVAPPIVADTKAPLTNGLTSAIPVDTKQARAIPAEAGKQRASSRLSALGTSEANAIQQPASRADESLPTGVNESEKADGPADAIADLTEPHVSLDLRTKNSLEKKTEDMLLEQQSDNDVAMPSKTEKIDGAIRTLSERTSNADEQSLKSESSKLEVPQIDPATSTTKVEEPIAVKSEGTNTESPTKQPTAAEPARNTPNTSSLDRVLQMEQSMKTKEPRVVSIRIPLVDGDGSGKHLDLVFRNRGEDLSLKMAIQGDAAQQQISSELPSLLKKLETIDWHAAPQANLENNVPLRDTASNPAASRAEFGSSIALNQSNSADAGSNDPSRNSPDEGFTGGGQSQNPQEQERRRNAGKNNNWLDLLQAEFSE